MSKEITITPIKDMNLGDPPGFFVLNVPGGTFSTTGQAAIKVTVKKGLQGTLQFGNTNYSFEYCQDKEETQDAITYTFYVQAEIYFNSIQQGSEFSINNPAPEPIKEAIQLVNVLNYMTAGCAQIAADDPNKVEILQSFKQPNYSFNTIKFVEGGTPITIHSQVTDYQSWPTWEIAGGELNLLSEKHMGSANIESGSLTLSSKVSLDKVTMQDGNLLIKDIARCSFLTLNGGSLAFDGTQSTKSEGPYVQELTANGGSVSYTHGETARYIEKAVIAGDVTFTGENQIGTDETRGTNYPFLAEQIVMQSGTVSMTKMGLHIYNDLTLQGGNLTLQQCALTKESFNTTQPSPTPCIQQTGGTLLMKDCLFYTGTSSNKNETERFIQVEDGTLTIDGGVYCAGATHFLYLSGANAKVNIMNGIFPMADGANYCSIYQENGQVDITNGDFSSAVCITKGTLNISNVYMTNANAQWNNIDSHIHILGSEAKVTLSGGYFGSQAVYPDPSLSVKPADLLAEGCGFYTWNQELQPDIPLEENNIIITNYANQTTYFEFGQVKKIETSPENDLLEAAQTANVGENGTDVKVVVVENAPYRCKYKFEVNTEKGLAWLASNQSIRMMPQANGYVYTRGEVLEVKLTVDLDMSSYEWIPFQYPTRKFDGQGHTISGLRVHQKEAAFMTTAPDTLANLVVSGTFHSQLTNYSSPSGSQMAAGLAIHNHGVIVNCGVQQSTVSCETMDNIYAHVAGLVASNRGSIQNSYMTGSVSCSAETSDRILEPNHVYQHYVGGIAVNSNGKITNCYQADGAVTHTISVDHNKNLAIYKDDLVVNEKYSQDIKPENCTNTPSLEALNLHVTAYNDTLPNGAIKWSVWITSETKNNGYPIHEYKEEEVDPDDPSAIETQIALLAKGNGKLVATYFIKDDDPSITPEQRTIESDTTLNISNVERFVLTAIPGKGARLDSVTRRMANQPELKLEGIEANKEFEYDVAFLSATLTAYFHTDTLYVEKDTTVIGGVGEITKVDHVQIADAGEEGNPAVIELGNVQVVPKEPAEGEEKPEATTQIEATANVVLQLTGKNNLGALINEGTTTIKKNPNATEEVSLETTSVVNKGTLIDETGCITEVKGENEVVTLLAIVNNNEEVEVTENESATLQAEAAIPSGATVSFQWQVWQNGKWENQGESTSYPLSTKARKANLRAEGENVTYTDTHTTEALAAGSSLLYRCLITTETTKSGDQSSKVSTTLTTYSTVAVSAQPEENSFTISFNANGGSVNPATAQTGADGKLTSLPTPIRDGYTFKGWFTAAGKGDKVTTSNVFTSDATIYAHWTKVSEPEPDPDPTPDPTPDPWYTYYDVVLPEVKGATTDPKAGTYELIEGGNFKFKLTLDPAYSKSEVVVKIGEELLTPDTDGYYHIKNIKADLVITITGITLDNPVGNATVEQPLKVWCNQSVLHIYTAERTPVHIYSLDGRLVRQFEVCGSTSISDLSRGHYIVQIGNRVWKIVL